MITLKGDCTVEGKDEAVVDPKDHLGRILQCYWGFNRFSNFKAHLKDIWYHF